MDTGTEHRRRVVRLLFEGSVLRIVVALVLSGVFILGNKGVTAEADSSVAGAAPTRYVVACPLPEVSEKGAAPATTARDGTRCTPMVRHHTSTSRQPGAGVAEQARRGDG
jgi:hypothetical protein